MRKCHDLEMLVNQNTWDCDAWLVHDGRDLSARGTGRGWADLDNKQSTGGIQQQRRPQRRHIVLQQQLPPHA